MKKPVKIEAQSFDEMIEEAHIKAIEAAEEFKNNGGMCLHCGKHPGDSTSKLQPMHCKGCNEETEKLLQQLRGPGFMELRL